MQASQRFKQPALGYTRGAPRSRSRKRVPDKGHIKRVKKEVTSEIARSKSRARDDRSN